MLRDTLRDENVNEIIKIPEIINFYALLLILIQSNNYDDNSRRLEMQINKQKREKFLN